MAQDTGIYFIRVKALAHYNWNYKKSRYRPYTLQLFFTTAQDFLNSFIYGQRFSQQFFGKFVVKIFVVCEGLKVTILPVHEKITKYRYPREEI